MKKSVSHLFFVLPCGFIFQNDHLIFLTHRALVQSGKLNILSIYMEMDELFCFFS